MYTIEQRLKIYEKMLKDFSLVGYDNLSKVNASRGFCLWYSCNYPNDEDGLYNDFKNTLPELAEVNPNGGDFDSKHYHWFDISFTPNNQNERVTCLKKAIEICKSKMQ